MKRSKRRNMDGKTMEINLFDELGNQESHRTYQIKVKLGSGWVPFYKRALNKLIEDCPKFSILKVYLRLAARQTYQKFVVVTQSQIAKELSMKPTTVSEAIKWLKDNEYLQIHDVDGHRGYLLNANVTLCGTKNVEGKAEIWQLQKQKEAVEAMDIELEKKKRTIESLNRLLADKILDGEPEDDEDEAFTDVITPIDVTPI